MTLTKRKIDIELQDGAKPTEIQWSKKPVIKVRVLLFGPVAEIVGLREEQMELYDGSTVADVYAGYRSTFRPLNDMKVKCAVDQQYCSWLHLLADGEEVALFTAVSGG